MKVSFLMGAAIWSAWYQATPGALANTRDELQFSIGRVAAVGDKGRFPIYLALRNRGREVARLVPTHIPIVWSFFYDRVARDEPRARQASVADETIEDVHSVIFARTDQIGEAQQVCRAAEGLVVIAAGRGALVETIVDFGLLEDGTYEVTLNLAVLVAPGRENCGAARFARGEARLKVKVKGDQVRLATQIPDRR